MLQRNWARQLVSCTFKLLWFHLSIMCLHAKKYTDSSILYQYTVYLSIYNPDWPQHLWPKVVEITINLRWISISIQNITLTDHIFFEISFSFLKNSAIWLAKKISDKFPNHLLPSLIYISTYKKTRWLTQLLLRLADLWILQSDWQEHFHNYNYMPLIKLIYQFLL